MSLVELLSNGSVEAEAIGRYLDGLTHEQRVRETRTIPRGLMAKLFASVSGNRRVSVDDMVPQDYPVGVPIRHLGTNSLPLFRVFEKPMYRDENGVVCGRNVQFWAWLTGPGYFTVGPHEGTDGEVLFDYINLPSHKPDSWPKIRDNARGLSFFVYRGMIDAVRSVSEHVTIGEAERGGKKLGQYFILVRQDPEAALQAAEQPKALAAGE